MRRKARSPLQREILVVLGEAGEENLPTLANTIWPRSEYRSPEAFLELLEVALEDLRRDELITYERFGQNRCWTLLSDIDSRNLFPLSGCLVRTNHFWEWDETRWGHDRVSVLLSQKGREALTQ